MLIYKQIDSLEMINYFYLDFVGYINTRKSTSSSIFMLTSRSIFWSNKKRPWWLLPLWIYFGYIFLIWL